jgi:hypothetical protein
VEPSLSCRELFLLLFGFADVVSTAADIPIALSSTVARNNVIVAVVWMSRPPDDKLLAPLHRYRRLLLLRHVVVVVESVEMNDGLL